MPMYATINLIAKFDNGPNLSTKGMLEAGSYLAVDETICRCEDMCICLNAGAKSEVALLVVSADKYMPDAKDLCMRNGENGNGDKRKRIYFAFHEKPVSHDPKLWTELNGPFMASDPLVQEIKPIATTQLDKIYFWNAMPFDVKVSVLIIRKKAVVVPAEQPGQGPAKAAACCGH